MPGKKFKSVSDYLAAQPPPSRARLRILRKAIREAAPQAEETISYGIPAYKLNGMLVWFAGFKQHVGFYPKTSAMARFKKELAKYKTSKGAIQFPLEKPVPVGLVKKIVRFRVQENRATGKKR